MGLKLLRYVCKESGQAWLCRVYTPGKTQMRVFACDLLKFVQYARGHASPAVSYGTCAQWWCCVSLPTETQMWLFACHYSLNVRYLLYNALFIVSPSLPSPTSLSSPTFYISRSLYLFFTLFCFPHPLPLRIPPRGIGLSSIAGVINGTLLKAPWHSQPSS